MSPTIGLPPPEPESCLVHSRGSRYRGGTSPLTGLLNFAQPLECEQVLTKAGRMKACDPQSPQLPLTCRHGRSAQGSW
jgi:hypothetical protein